MGRGHEPARGTPPRRRPAGAWGGKGRALKLPAPTRPLLPCAAPGPGCLLLPERHWQAGTVAAGHVRQHALRVILARRPPHRARARPRRIRGASGEELWRGRYRWLKIPPATLSARSLASTASAAGPRPPRGRGLRRRASALARGSGRRALGAPDPPTPPASPPLWPSRPRGPSRTARGTARAAPRPRRAPARTTRPRTHWESSQRRWPARPAPLSPRASGSQLCARRGRGRARTARRRTCGAFWGAGREGGGEGTGCVPARGSLASVHQPLLLRAMPPTCFPCPPLPGTLRRGSSSACRTATTRSRTLPPGRVPTPPRVTQGGHAPPREARGTARRPAAAPTQLPPPASLVPACSTRFGFGGRFGMSMPDTPGPDAYGLPGETRRLPVSLSSLSLLAHRALLPTPACLQTRQA